MPENWQENGFGIYIHWPFCAHKCPYCDFNSHVAEQIDHVRWADAYCEELETQARLVPDRVVRSIFFGGGTPSLMHGETVARVLDKARSLWPLANDCEITLEANPTSVEADRFAAYAAAGVNRVSMGIQALNDDDLRRLGRMHSADEAMGAFAIARDNFERVSFDLIYARQGQPREQWQEELHKALSLALDHVSLYQLTIEEGTVFASRAARGHLRDMPHEDLAADMFEDTYAICEPLGFHGYEVSNFAKAGCEAQHNLIYWRSGDYLGIGPGAHGRLSLGTTRIATVSPKSPTQWLLTKAHTAARISHETLSQEAQISEFLLMGLRLREGVSHAQFQTRFARDIPWACLEKLTELDLIEDSSDIIKVTNKGRLLLNYVIAQLIEAL